jgi:hypothetical protein
MTRRSRLLALVLSAGLAAGAYQLVTPGAGAAEQVVRFDKTTVAVNDRNRESTGQAHVRGSVTWDDRDSFTSVGYIDDRCFGTATGDGYGAFFEGDVVFMDGTRYRLGVIAKDERGCTDGPKAIAKWAYYGTKVVRKVDFALVERNSAGRLGQTIRWSMDNPHTG